MRNANGSGVSRRNVFGIIAAVASGPMLVTRAFASRSAWQSAVPLSSGTGAQPRYLHAAVGTGDGRVVVIGGYPVSDAIREHTSMAPSGSVQLYDPVSGAWTDLAPLNVPRARHAAVSLPDGRIVVLGGYYASPITSVEIYDPRRNVWMEGEPIPMPMMDHSASFCGDCIVLTGGQDGLPAVTISVPPSKGVRP